MLPFALFRLVRRLVALVVLAVVVVVGVTATRVWWVARQDDRRPSDVIVVLGASQLNGRPSAILQSRLDHARTLYLDHVAPRVIAVGGSQPGDRFTEGEAGRMYLTAHGVPDAIAVGEGTDTLQSLQAVKRQMDARGWRTAVLVTDPWHCLRSRRMATDLGIGAVTSPTRSGPAVATRTVQARYIARETAAYLYYRAFGRSIQETALGRWAKRSALSG